METIKKYIQFAIDNWYKWNKKTLVKELRMHITDWLIFKTKDLNTLWIWNIITSKEFIEAVAKWLMDDEIIVVFMWGKWINYMPIEIEHLIDDITTYQAIAIRDNKLEEFINNLLTNK